MIRLYALQVCVFQFRLALEGKDIQFDGLTMPESERCGRRYGWLANISECYALGFLADVSSMPVIRVREHAVSDNEIGRNSIWGKVRKALLWLYPRWSTGYNLPKLTQSALGMDSAAWFSGERQYR